jgi:hypothetical protein
MTDSQQPEIFYAMADDCPHDIRSEDEEPGDGIHVPEDYEGFLICLKTPHVPEPGESLPGDTQPVNGGYTELPNFSKGKTALQCETCSTIVNMVEGQENWMIRHIYNNHLQPSTHLD